MEKFKKLFSKMKKSLASMKNIIIKLFNRMNFEKIKKIHNNCTKKINKFKNFFYDKVKIGEEIVWILIPCILTLFIVLILKPGINLQTYNIAKNKGEEAYYEGNYDLAISEYNSLQEMEEWPEYTLEVANIYSMSHELEKSNSILKESIIIRDRLNKENIDIDNTEKDEEFINKILFIFNMNKDYDETIGLGEQYLKEKGISNDIIKNLFMAYFAKNHEYKAEELLNKFIVEEDSVADKTELANMKGLMGDFNGAFELLKEAFNLEPKSILIYDTIEELFEFNSEALIEALESQESNDTFYKFMLIKAYSQSSKEEHINKAKDLYSELGDEENDNYILDLIGYSIYKDINYLENAYENSENEEEYIEAYVKALYNYKTDNIKEAKNESYRSITLKEDYDKVYVLLADIMNREANNKASEVYLREALEKKPYSYKTILKIENFYSNVLVDEVNARYYLDMAINIRKEDSNLYYKLAKLDLSIESYEDAIINLEEAISLDPENGNYYRTLGAIHLELENYEEGIENTRYAYSLNENDVLALNNAAVFYVNVERDVYRAYDNITSAFEDMPLSVSEENKEIIIENYNKIKSLYESGDEDYTDMDLKLIY